MKIFRQPAKKLGPALFYNNNILPLILTPPTHYL